VTARTAVILARVARRLGWDGLVLVALLVTSLAGAIVYKAVSHPSPGPGPGWIKGGPLADIERQGVTELDNSAYVVSYHDFPIFAFAASYSDGTHEVVSYCPSSGWFYNEPHGTEHNIVGRYMLGPAPSSTLPRVAVMVLDGEVWVDPGEQVAGLIAGATEVHQPPRGPSCE